MILTVYILSFNDYSTNQVEDKTKILRYIGYKMLEESYLQLGRFPSKDVISELSKMTTEGSDDHDIISFNNRLVVNPNAWNDVLSVFLKVFGNVFIGLSYVSDGIVYTIYKIPFVIILLVLVLFISSIINNGT